MSVLIGLVDLGFAIGLAALLGFSGWVGYRLGHWRGRHGVKK